MPETSNPSNLHQFLNTPSPHPPPSSFHHSQTSTMEGTLQDPFYDEWEFLPDNSSFLELGLDKIEDLFSNEIIYTDYFREEPKLIQQTPADNQEEESQLQDISISHVFLKIINPKIEEELIESTRSSSEPKQSVSEFVVREIEASPSILVMEEKVSFGEMGGSEEEEEKEIWEGIGIGLWRRRFMGAAALFSIGAAAAVTICVVVLGGREGKQPGRRQHRSNLFQFHFHDEQKSMSRVVEQASRLNHALAAARGSPTMMRPAKISFGGCYDGL
ncbi:uncharacterized protein LOC110031365 [Phalaenopsis equestris]|uniref:uncharacterized protein LOC110031365 n=1 Tax=Phalaenopsis equestris TaxID=78828 RepID=UPI0009E25644|nr:uncharacterized protein LOC110031365 [Phalaenopsis equestris]